MCVVSMVMDHYRDRWYPLVPAPHPYPTWPGPQTPLPYPTSPLPAPSPLVPQITQEEVEEFRRLLERAREYDRKNNEPNCELDEKRDAIKKIAKKLGVEIDFL